MKLLITLITFLSFSCFALTTGEKAPSFTLSGEKAISLSDYKGKIVVLEWLNHGCPFVRKHYDSGNMQALQEKFTTKDVVWLSIISSAKGKQGYVTQKQSLQDKMKYKSKATHILLDPTGEVGRLYDAKTTPHMYIIDKEGLLVYQGAIDDKADTDQASIPLAKNFVAEALGQLTAGKKITIHTTKSYGCSVKY